MSECPNRKELFHHINEVSFAVDDIKLYLDTHPCDDEAMECFEEYSQLRNEALKEYAISKGISFDSLEDLVENNEIRKFIAERIERLQKGLAGFEKIKRFTLLPKEFTIENGELTNTLKIRRPAINSHYANEIEAMYC